MKKCCLKQRKEFAKEILDMLDEVVRGTPELMAFIYPIKQSIREVRDNCLESPKLSGDPGKDNIL